MPKLDDIVALLSAAAMPRPLQDYAALAVYVLDSCVLPTYQPVWMLNHSKVNRIGLIFGSRHSRISYPLADVYEKLEKQAL
jgi:hypothetical protein